MLVLTRKTNERIRIGDNIVVTVVQVRGGSVRLGIDAPSDVSIVRDELMDNPGKKGADNYGPHEQ